MKYTDIIENAKSEKRQTLSEYESKEIIKEFGIRVPEEHFIKDLSELTKIFDLRYPVVAKGISKAISHKTEKNLVRLWIKNEEELKREFLSLKSIEGVEGVLITRQFTDKREFLLGLKYDLQFGYTIVFGLGGIFTEALKDISIRICPINERDAADMISEIRSSKLLNEIRGYPPINREELIKMILNLSSLSEKIPEIAEVDINPVMFENGEPFAIDALIILNSNP